MLTISKSPHTSSVLVLRFITLGVVSKQLVNSHHREGERERTDEVFVYGRTYGKNVLLKMSQVVNNVMHGLNVA